MQCCKTITLRSKLLKNGMLSFYLDFYPAYRDKLTMKTIRHEFLGIYIYANPKNQRERLFNYSMTEKADAAVMILSLMNDMISLTRVIRMPIFLSTIDVLKRIKTPNGNSYMLTS